MEYQIQGDRRLFSWWARTSAFNQQSLRVKIPVWLYGIQVLLDIFLFSKWQSKYLQMHFC